MTALMLSLVLCQSLVAATEEAPAAAAAPTESPAAAPKAPEVAPPPARPSWKTLPENPVFVRAFSVAVLSTGAVLATVGACAFAVMLALRFSPALDRVREDERTNAVGLSSLIAATGLVVGGVLALGGVLGIILL